MECLCLTPNLIINSLTRSPQGSAKPVADAVEDKVGHLFSSDPASWYCFCPPCHVVHSHDDVCLPTSISWQQSNGINAPLFKRPKRGDGLLRTKDELPGSCTLTCITRFTLEICISLQRWPNKSCLQDFIASKLIGKVPAADIVVTLMEDAMYVVLGRNLTKHLVLPLAKQIFINKLIPHRLPCQPPSFSFG